MLNGKEASRWQSEWEDFQVLAARRRKHETRTVPRGVWGPEVPGRAARHALAFGAAGGELNHPGDVQPLSRPGAGVLPAAKMGCQCRTLVEHL
jgi:hypothetical protein